MALLMVLCPLFMPLPLSFASASPSSFFSEVSLLLPGLGRGLAAHIYYACILNCKFHCKPTGDPAALSPDDAQAGLLELAGKWRL